MPSEQGSIVIDTQGWLGNGGEAKAVFEYGGETDGEARLITELFETLLVIDTVCEFFLIYK
jgi:hypothetical protein